MGMNIFGGFTGGLFNNNLGFSPGLLPGQVVPTNPNFDPSPLLNAFFQPYPWATNGLILSNQIALIGGGPPLIASYPTVNPFPNQFLNQFNPAMFGGGGLPPMAPAPAPGPQNPVSINAQSRAFSSPTGIGNAMASLQGMGIGGLGGLQFLGI